jgi:hypothetical protein
MTQQLDGTSWGILDAAAIVAEIDRDLAEREAHYPEQQRKGRLDKSEADYLLELIRDIREDLQSDFAPLQPGEIREPRKPRVTWPLKTRWIRGELEHRRKRLPDLVAKGRITELDCERRIGTMEQLERLYWNRMFMWEPPVQEARDYLAARSAAARSGAGSQSLDGSEGQRIYRDSVRAHLSAVALESGQAQGELAA